jgi:hypothetical protein
VIAREHAASGWTVTIADLDLDQWGDVERQGGAE